MIDSLEIVNTNTKVRRIGYLKALADFLTDQKKISSNFINIKFEEFCLQYQNDLSLYKNDKGLIKKTLKGTSAKPYITLANEFDFLNLLNSNYSAGKLFKVYIQVRKKLNERELNIFQLSRFDEAFFLECIFKHDLLYISCLLELVGSNSECSYTSLVEQFQNEVVKKLGEIKEKLRTIAGGENVLKRTSQLMERILNWKEPEVYLEHVIMPRLNWLLDLELLEMIDSSAIMLSPFGRNALNETKDWAKRDNERIVTVSDLLDSTMIKSFNNIYSSGANISVDVISADLRIKSIVDNLIRDSFSYFKTLAPNRVTSSQAINFTKYMLFFSHEIVMDFVTLEQYLKSNDQEQFIYKHQHQYGDGYIQIKR